MSRYSCGVVRTGSGGDWSRSPVRGLLALLALVLACGGVAAAAVGTGASRRTGGSPVLRHVRYANRAARATRAKRANSASRVNGFKVAFTPTPNSLLALDAQGRFPDSVKPATILGPPGPPGAPGRSGKFASQIVTVNAGETSCADKSINGTNAVDQTKPAIGCAACPVNQPVIGGGFKDISAAQLPSGSSTTSRPPGSFDAALWNAPLQQPDGSTAWEARVLNVPPKTGGTSPPPGLVVLQVYAICGSL